MKLNKLIVFLIAIPMLICIGILLIFTYLEFRSKNAVFNQIPSSFKEYVNEDEFEKIDLVGEKVNDTIFYFNSIPEINSTSNLYFSNFLKGENFKVTFEKDNELNKESTIDKNQSDVFTSPNGIYKINYVPKIDDIRIKVKDFKQIESNLFECYSHNVSVQFNSKKSLEGKFPIEKFYIQFEHRDKYSFLLIYSSKEEEKLNQFRNLIK